MILCVEASSGMNALGSLLIHLYEKTIMYPAAPVRYVTSDFEING